LFVSKRYLLELFDFDGGKAFLVLSDTKFHPRTIGNCPEAS